MDLLAIVTSDQCSQLLGELKLGLSSHLVCRLSLTLIFPSKVNVQGQGLIQVSPPSAVRGGVRAPASCSPPALKFGLRRRVTFSLLALGGAVSTAATRWQHFRTDHIHFLSTPGGFCHQHQDLFSCSESRCRSKTLGYMSSQQKILRRLVPARIYSSHALPTQCFLRP